MNPSSNRVVLHVGAMKSGTSYVQGQLMANRAWLQDNGVLFPGTSWRDQVLAAQDVLLRRRGGDPVPGSQGKWDDLVAQMRSFSGTSVISMEYFGTAPLERAQAIRDELAEFDVTVVITARDLGRGLPALWQEWLQNRHSPTWDEALASIQQDDPTPRSWGARFRRELDVAAMARVWTEAFGIERVVLVTVPPPGADRDELWHRFAQASGLPAALPAPPTRQNTGLGVASAELMRRLNHQLRELPIPAYNRLVKSQLSKKGLAGRRAEEAPVGFEVPGWLRRRSRAMVRELKRSKVRVIGDLEDLKPRSVQGADPRAVTPQELAAAAEYGISHLVEVWSASQTDLVTAQ